MHHRPLRGAFFVADQTRQLRPAWADRRQHLLVCLKAGQGTEYICGRYGQGQEIDTHEITHFATYNFLVTYELA